MAQLAHRKLLSPRIQALHFGVLRSRGVHAFLSSNRYSAIAAKGMNMHANRAAHPHQRREITAKTRPTAMGAENKSAARGAFRRAAAPIHELTMAPTSAALTVINERRGDDIPKPLKSAAKTPPSRK